MDQVTVSGDLPSAAGGILAASSGTRLPENIGGAAAAVPGVALHSMGASAVEPLLRGLGSDRVVTTLDGLPLPGASPTRTASPLALIPGGLPSTIGISQALPSVTLGPAANAGYIELGLAGANPVPGASLTAAGNSDRRGGSALAEETTIRGSASLRAAATAHSLGDYTAGDGTVVPACDRSAGATLALAWQPDSRRRFRLGGLLSRQELAVNSALPLDTRDTGTAAVTAGCTWTPSGGTSIDVRGGASLCRPHLDNHGRAAAALINADGRTLSQAAGITFRRVLASGAEIAAGADASNEERRLERRRPTATDLLWPDLCQTDAGAFFEATCPLNSDWKLRAGARVDSSESEARAADGLAFGRTIRSLYVAYNGPAAAQVRRSETGGAANVLLRGRISPELTATFGAGFSRQPPGASERFRAFSDALGGGYEIGNPTANAEEKYEFDGAIRWKRPRLTVSLNGFGSRLPNYLHRTRVGITAGPSPAAGAIVYGYRAIAADFWGGEIQAQFRPGADSWMRLTAAAVDARDRSAHRGLPEIPPASAGLAAGRLWSRSTAKPWVELGLRGVAAQRNPAAYDMPVFADSAAYALADVHIGATWHGLRVSLSVENLLDRLHREYLSPPAAATPPSGTLRPGVRIPGAGRTFTLTLHHALP